MTGPYKILDDKSASWHKMVPFFKIYFIRKTIGGHEVCEQASSPSNGIRSFGANQRGKDPQLSRLKNSLARRALAKFFKTWLSQDLSRYPVWGQTTWFKSWKQELVLGILYGGKPRKNQRKEAWKILPRDWNEHVPSPQSLGEYVRDARDSMNISKWKKVKNTWKILKN